MSKVKYRGYSALPLAISRSSNGRSSLVIYISSVDKCSSTVAVTVRVT